MRQQFLSEPRLCITAQHHEEPDAGSGNRAEPSREPNKELHLSISSEENQFETHLKRTLSPVSLFYSYLCSETWGIWFRFLKFETLDLKYIVFKS